jgi:ABC-type glutathione transport system ATPase component
VKQRGDAVLDRLRCRRIRSLDVTENVLLEAASLFKRYTRVQALTAAGLVVRRGEVYALVCKSGSGTSTAEPPAAEEA